MKVSRKISIFPILILILVFLSCCGGKNLHESSAGLAIRQADLFWPPQPQEPKIQYLRSIASPMDIGIKKSRFEKFLDTIFGEDDNFNNLLRPYGIFADKNRIYVTDPGLSLLHVFDLQEKKYFSIKETEEEDLQSPIGVSVDEKGTIYITDSLLKKVIAFDRNGKYLKTIGSPQIFLRPSGIDIEEDNIYVVDTHLHKVLVFSKINGLLLFSFGKNGIRDGEFNFPTNIFIDAKKNIYITDSMNFRIQVFDKEGNFLFKFGQIGDALGDFSKPKGIAVDSDGNIYVADAHFDNIQIFDRNGKLLLVFGETGAGKGQMILPAGLFIDTQDKIYVADSYNKRVQIFQYLKDTKNKGALKEKVN